MHTLTHSRAMYTPTKRTVRVTLDIECYDDLDLESFDWNDILGLEGDENVESTMEEKTYQWSLCQFVDCPLRKGWIFL